MRLKPLEWERPSLHCHNRIMSQNNNPYGHHGLSLGVVLVCCLLFSRIAGKSYLSSVVGNVWQMQMAVVCVSVFVGFFYCLASRYCNKGRNCNYNFPGLVKACLIALFVTCVSSCLAQKNWTGNLIYLLVFAGMVYLLCLNGSVLLDGISRFISIEIVTAPLVLMAFISLVFPPRGITHIRFSGFYCDPIVAGQMFGLTCLVMFWCILHLESGRRLGYLIFLPFALLCLTLTRTRTGLLGTSIGMTICLLTAMRAGTASISRQRAQFYLIVLTVVLGFSAIWTTRQYLDLNRTKEYLRVSGDLDDILRNRADYWQTGTKYLSIANVLGKGPLAKFGNSLSTRDSGYVRDENTHNAFLSVFQFYGWSGGILFITFLLSVGTVYYKRRDPYAVLGSSLITFGFVQCLTENWLLSFGTPIDAYSWLIFGITLPHKNADQAPFAMKKQPINAYPSPRMP